MKDRDINIVDLLLSLLRKKWIILMFTLLGCIIGSAIGAYKNYRYNITTEKQIREKQEKINEESFEEGDIDALFESVLSPADIEAVKKLIKNEQYVKERIDYLASIDDLNKLTPDQYWYVHNIEDVILVTKATIIQEKEGFSSQMRLYYNYLSGVDDTVNYDELTDNSSAGQEVFIPISLINKKYIVVGFVAGLFITVCCLAFLYIIDPRIRVCDNISELFGINVVGVIGRKNSLLDESLNLACASINLRMSKENISKASLLGCNMISNGVNYANKIQEKIKECSIEICGNPLNSPDDMLKLKNVESVILIEKATKTKCIDIANEINLCKEVGIEVLGIILVA